MKTLEELKALASAIYWNVEHGEMDKAAEELRKLQVEALDQAAAIAWSFKVPQNTDHDYVTNLACQNISIAITKKQKQLT